ncbi:MAG: hypothetical protein PF482_01290 [Desulfobacteraceae bacterium]|nr:hypothetical protein [Desulfobacteraceae bacterium]
MRLSFCIFWNILILLSASPAFAYIGPGLGAGTLAVVVGFVGSIFLAIFALVWYPLKRLLTKTGILKKKKSDKS